MVFNACNSSTDFDLQEVRSGLQECGVPVCPGAVYQRVSFSRGFIPGKIAQEIEPGGRAADEIERLFEWVAHKLKLDLMACAPEIDVAA